MKTMNYLKIMMMAFVTLGLASCGDEYYDDEYLKNSDDKLCDVNWESYYVEDGLDVVETYFFSRNGTGKEIVEFYRPNENTPIKTTSKALKWEWINNMEGIFMEIYDSAPNRLIYMDDVLVRTNYLSCEINGYRISYKRRGATK